MTSNCDILSKSYKTSHVTSETKKCMFSQVTFFYILPGNISDSFSHAIVFLKITGNCFLHSHVLAFSVSSNFFLTRQPQAKCTTSHCRSNRFKILLPSPKDSQWCLESTPSVWVKVIPNLASFLSSLPSSDLSLLQGKPTPLCQLIGSVPMSTHIEISISILHGWHLINDIVETLWDTGSDTLGST